MPVYSSFKTCAHGPNVPDWRECFQCIDEVTVQLTIARSYLTELARAEFNNNGDCTKPVAEPVFGRHFQQIAQTALGVIS